VTLANTLKLSGVPTVVFIVVVELATAITGVAGSIDTAPDTATIPVILTDIRIFMLHKFQELSSVIQFVPEHLVELLL
jgi:hypothetical protein